MYTHKHQIRVRYADTDQMGLVYYGNYATFYEVGRVEAIRSLGFSYKEIEDMGVIMPVIENWSKFIRPAVYDDLLTIQTAIKEIQGSRITFEYELYNQANTLLNIGYTKLVWLKPETMKPAPFPEPIKKSLLAYGYTFD